TWRSSAAALSAVRWVSATSSAAPALFSCRSAEGRARSASRRRCTGSRACEPCGGSAAGGGPGGGSGVRLSRKYLAPAPTAPIPVATARPPKPNVVMSCAAGRKAQNESAAAEVTAPAPRTPVLTVPAVVARLARRRWRNNRARGSRHWANLLRTCSKTGPHSCSRAASPHCTISWPRGFTGRPSGLPGLRVLLLLLLRRVGGRRLLLATGDLLLLLAAGHLVVAGVHGSAQLRQPVGTSGVEGRLLHLQKPPLGAVLGQLGLAQRGAVPALDLVPDLFQRRGASRRGELGHLPQRVGHLLLHLGLLQLAEQLAALGQLLLQHLGVALHGLLGLLSRLDRLVVQGLEVFHALLSGHQLAGELRRGLLVALRLGLVPFGPCLVRHRQRLLGGGLQLLHLAELPVQLHLQLPLVADDRGGLLGKRLVLALRFFDGLLDLHLGIGVLVDFRRERRHQVLPELRERVGHLLRLPSPTAQLRRTHRRRARPVLSCQVSLPASTKTGTSPGFPGSVPKIEPGAARPATPGSPQCQ